MSTVYRFAPRARSSRSAAVQRPLRRFHPARGQPLTMDCIRGPWRPSGAVQACGVFAVVWSTFNTDFWAPLHDFDAASQLRLIEIGRRLYVEPHEVDR